jgi:hypothetical protein
MLEKLAGPSICGRTGTTPPISTLSLQHNEPTSCRAEVDLSRGPGEGDESFKGRSQLAIHARMCIDSSKSANSRGCERKGQWSLSISTMSSHRFATSRCTLGTRASSRWHTT